MRQRMQRVAAAPLPLPTTTTTTASTSCVRNLRLMLDASAKHLVNAKADAAVAPLECGRMSNTSPDCLANAKANAADAPV